MCGITGAVLKDGTGSAAQFLLPALKRLEYRGYDSAGQATILKGQICISKDAGRIDDVSQRLHLASMEGCVGIAHTRWATHGVPCMDNAHPLMDCSGRIAIVHNVRLLSLTGWEAKNLDGYLLEICDLAHLREYVRPVSMNHQHVVLDSCACDRL